MAMQGLTAHVAMAATPGAAQALARYGSIQICDDIPAALAPLPTAALRLDDTTVQLLNRLGLKTIGSLAEMPRVSLMRRFSTLPDDRNPLVLLDRAVGRTADPLNAPVDPQQFITRSRLPEPVMDAAPHMADLARQLCQQLTQAEYGARSIRLTIYRIDGEWRQLSLNTARASRDPDHMLRLFRDKLERIDPGFGFDLLTLEALQVEPLSQIQQRLDGRRDSDADLAALLDRLSARLGQDKVSWSRYVQTHKPEAVEHRQPAMAGDPTPPPAPPRERPLRLLTPAEEVQVIYAVPEGPPSQFRWRRVLYKTARHEGPERIAPEWWRDRPGTRLRDYYKVEVQDGRRFWLYREGVVHDGRGDTPRWFLHGLFA
jgi:protein ImuB